MAEPSFDFASMFSMPSVCISCSHTVRTIPVESSRADKPGVFN